jgi:hypothetical protein
MMLEKRASLDLPLCCECGGRCCKGSPGVWVDPERFFAIFFSGQHLSLEQLRECLPGLGLVLWEKSGVPIPAPRSLASGCSFLEVDGCRFPVAERPCQCLALIPNKETLVQEQGCLCQEPEAFSRFAARQLWQDYWSRGDSEQ